MAESYTIVRTTTIGDTFRYKTFNANQWQNDPKNVL